MDAHSQKEKEKNKKARQTNSEAAGTTTTKDHTRTAKTVLQERRLQQRNSVQTPSSLDHRSMVFTLKRVRLNSRQCLQQGDQ
jgi:hypothetical protein